MPHSLSKMRKFSHLISIRSYVLILIVSCIIPITAFSFYTIKIYAETQRDSSEEYLLTMTKILSSNVKLKIESIRSALDVLVNSQTMKDRNFERLHNVSREIGLLHGGYIILQDVNGQIFNTLKPLTSQVEPVSTWAKIAIETGVWNVSDLRQGSGPDVFEFEVNTPVVDDGVVRYVLTMVFNSKSLADLLVQENFKPGWRAAIIDRAGLIVARNLAG